MKSYRKAVCIVVRNPGTSKVLVCHRIGAPPLLGWQFPQGGRDKGERVVTAALRELGEEIGTTNVSVCSITKDSFTYDFPANLVNNVKNKYRGQSQRWVLVDFNGVDSDISFVHIPAEFDGYKWVSPATALRNVVEFKKECYRQGLAALDLIPSA